MTEDEIQAQFNAKHDTVHTDLQEKRAGKLRFRKLIETDDLDHEIVTIVNDNFWELLENPPKPK